MKHAVLTSIAHNIADSLASGIGLLIGHYEMDVFSEAADSPTGRVEVDFLAGTISGVRRSSTLTPSVRLYSQALPALCESQGAVVSDFETLVVSYSSSPTGREFTVEVVDRNGRRSRDRYLGWPGARPKVLDALGRVRRVTAIV